MFSPFTFLALFGLFYGLFGLFYGLFGQFLPDLMHKHLF